MSLVKWFRKNNKKVMAVVVIVIMFGFVGGSYLSRLGEKGSRPAETVAYFLDNKKITNYDLGLARQELDILRTLRADSLLQAQDMQGILLAELLFAEQAGRGASPTVVNYIRRTIAQNQYRISNKDIADMYKRSVLSTAYWVLLKNETRRAGVRVAQADAGRLLASAIPQLYEGATYAQLIGRLVKAGTSEKQILATFGDLVAVLQYAHLICSNENVTIRQIMHTAAQENETIDIEFVKFDAEVFAKTQPQPAEDKMIEHFNKYRKFMPSAVSTEKSYGFGYKLPDRVRLEYIAVKLDDIESIVAPPTHEETEGYYQKNKTLFTEQAPSDPTDPNSPLTERTKSYAEVVDIITAKLLKDKIDSKSESILQQAKTLTEPNLVGTDLELEQLTSEQFREKAGDYETAVAQLSKEHNVKIYTGQTGLLNAAEMQTDEHLGVLSVRGSGNFPISLTQIVFAVDELAASELGPFDAPTPKMYENIGPAKDAFAGSRTRFSDTSEQIMAVVRLTEAIKEAEPNSIDETFSTHSFIFDPNRTDEKHDIYSVREKVTENLKRLAAIDTTKTRTEEFISLAARTSWETALDRFNELYGEQAKEDPNDPNVFKLDYLNALSRISSIRLKTLAIQNQGNPAAQFFLNQAKLERQFIDKLYALAPPDSNTPDVLPVVMEFNPNMSFLCIKNMSVRRLWKEDFDRIKPTRFRREDLIQFQSLAPVHFNPGNILKRMKFRFAEDDEKSTDANAPPEPEAAT